MHNSIQHSNYVWRIPSNGKIIFVVIGEAGNLLGRKFFKQLSYTLSVCHNL